MVAVGDFVEIGEADDANPIIANVLQLEAVKHGHVATVRVPSKVAETPVFNHPGKLRRVEKRGQGHWTIYHPAAKLTYDLVSGSRWFSERVYGGSDGAQSKAVETLSEWRAAFARERDKVEKLALFLCTSNSSEGQSFRRRMSCKMPFVQHWRVVHASSVEHMLHCAWTPATGAMAAKRRAAIIAAKGPKHKQDEELAVASSDDL